MSIRDQYGLNPSNEVIYGFCKEILEKYQDKIILPVDVLVNTVYEDVKNPELRLISEIKDDEMIN